MAYFADELKYLKKESGKTYKELAAITNTPYRTFQDWVAERRTPHDLVQEQIIQMLKYAICPHQERIAAYRATSIKQVFEFGFEQMNVKPVIPSPDRPIIYYSWKDFLLEGGSQERFKDYTVDRYEDEFFCIISFS